MRGERRRVRRLQHMVAVAVDKVAFLLRVRTPQQEHHAFTVLVQGGDHFVGKGFPAQLACECARPPSTVSTVLSSSTPVRPSFAGSRDPGVRSRECRLPALYTCSPATAAPARRGAPRKIDRAPDWGRDTDPAEDDDLDVRQLGIAESVEHVLLRWINGLTSSRSAATKASVSTK